MGKKKILANNISAKRLLSKNTKNTYKPTSKKKKKNLEFPGGLVVKDLALSPQLLGFCHRPGNFSMPWAQPKTKQNKNNPPIPHQPNKTNKEEPDF